MLLLRIRPSMFPTDIVVEQYDHEDPREEASDSVYLDGEELNNVLAALEHTRRTGERTEVHEGSWRVLRAEE